MCREDLEHKLGGRPNGRHSLQEARKVAKPTLSKKNDSFAGHDARARKRAIRAFMSKALKMNAIGTHAALAATPAAITKGTVLGLLFGSTAPLGSAVDQSLNFGATKRGVSMRDSGSYAQ
jgi:hypothetical protein